MSFLQGLFRTRDIWQPSYQSGEPDRVLGYEVHTSAYAPKDAISFGDYKYYNIGDRGARSFKQFYSINQNVQLVIALLTEYCTV